MTKNCAYRMKNELFVSKVIINNFEKNPMKGGTPAMDKSNTVINMMQYELKLKPLKLCSVLNCEAITLNIVQNKTIKETL